MKNNHDFKSRFFKDLGGLAITLGEQVSKERLQAYYDALTDDHGPEDILEAIRKAVKVCKFFPKPAELIELMTGGKGGGQDPAVAWQAVIHALEDVGSYANVEFEDGAIASAIEGLGGWAELGRMSYEDLKNHRIPAKFAALYAEAVRRGRHLKAGALYGSIDQDNAAKGFSLDAPTHRARTMTEIMAASEKRKQLPARPDLKLLADPDAEEAAQAEVREGMAKLRQRFGVDEDVPESVKKMRREESLRKELNRLGGGRAYFEVDDEPLKQQSAGYRKAGGR